MCRKNVLICYITERITHAYNYTGRQSQSWIFINFYTNYYQRWIILQMQMLSSYLNVWESSSTYYHVNYFESYFYVKITEIYSAK